MGQIKPGNVEELIDQVLQPLCLFKSNAQIFLLKCRGNFPFIMKKRQISDHGGERRLQVMSQIDDQVVFSLFSLVGGLPAFDDIKPYLIHMKGGFPQVIGHNDRFLLIFPEAVGGCQKLIQIGTGFREITVSENKSADEQI